MPTTAPRATVRPPAQRPADADPGRPAAPADGDIVIGPLPDAPLRFGLRQVPHEYQFASRRISECVSIGRRFATAHRVDVWSVDDGGQLLLIERNRALGHRRGTPEATATASVFALRGSRWPPAGSDSR
ncbi:MAG: hypothetical protein R2745_07770 [Vicinamibacterales bacterium]